MDKNLIGLTFHDRNLLLVVLSAHEKWENEFWCESVKQKEKTGQWLYGRKWIEKNLII